MKLMTLKKIQSLMMRQSQIQIRFQHRTMHQLHFLSVPKPLLDRHQRFPAFRQEIKRYLSD